MIHVAVALKGKVNTKENHLPFPSWSMIRLDTFCRSISFELMRHEKLFFDVEFGSYGKEKVIFGKLIIIFPLITLLSVVEMEFGISCFHVVEEKHLNFFFSGSYFGKNGTKINWVFQLEGWSLSRGEFSGKYNISFRRPVDVFYCNFDD